MDKRLSAVYWHNRKSGQGAEERAMGIGAQCPKRAAVLTLLRQRGYEAKIEESELHVFWQGQAAALQWPLPESWTPSELVWTVRVRLGINGPRYPRHTDGPDWSELAKEMDR